MFSFEKGIRKIARIEGGQYHGKTLYIYDENYKCCSRCSDACLKSKKPKCCDKCTKSKKGGCGTCGGGARESNVQTFKELRLTVGKIIPIPNEEPDQADHVYIAGQTGAGKSSWIGDYLEDLNKKKKLDIFLFSTFDTDKELDRLNPTRVTIDKDLVEDPIQKEELKDSICIFDDIDKIRPKELAEACRGVRDDLLENGRKMNIKVIATSHQLMNYKLTRDLLNSSQKIVFFPEATSPLHVKRFLTSYIGLDKKSLAYVNSIRSRWMMVSMTYPRYIIWETGCVLVNKIPELLQGHKPQKVVKQNYVMPPYVPKGGKQKVKDESSDDDESDGEEEPEPIKSQSKTKRVSFSKKSKKDGSDSETENYDDRPLKSILKRKT